jgi:hypothetical protein
MKPEIYSCLKMLESFRQDCRSIYNTRTYQSAISLLIQYQHIRDILSKNLSEEQIDFVPYIGDRHILADYQEAGLIQELISASGIAISYLRSLEGSLDNELREKQAELELKEKELESTKKILKDSIDAIKELPEVMRSGAVAEWKKKHREIEKYSKNKK